MADVHLTGHGACTAVCAAVHIDPDTDQRQFVEHAVYRSERAYKTAERAVAEYACQPDDHHDHKFAGEEYSEHLEKACVAGIGQQTHRSFECSRRTYVLAESRYGHALLQAVPQRHGDRKHNQEEILEI